MLSKATDLYLESLQIKKAVFPKGIQPFLFVDQPGLEPGTSRL